LRVAVTGAVSMWAAMAAHAATPATAATSLATSAAGGAAIAPWGVDLSAMDRSIRPGDDFYRYAGGQWMKSTQIPSDRSTWGSFDMLGAKAEEDVRQLVTDVSGKPQAPGSIEQKVADFYSSYMDTARIESLGLAPFKPDLERIAALSNHDQVAALAFAPAMPVAFPISLYFSIDDKNPDRYSANLTQSGLGMPNRDYYLKPDAKFVETRGKYRAYVEQMLKLAGYAEPAAAADAILALETRIAEIHWPVEKERDAVLIYNPRNRKELEASVPDLPWNVALDAAEIPKQDFFILNNPEPAAQLGKLFRETPVSTWRDYLTFHYLNSQADIMPVAFDDAAFEFNGKVLTGQPQKRDRWKRAVLALSGRYGEQPLGQAVGMIYVKEHFTPEAKAQMQELVANLLAAYRKRIETLEWMSPETRKVAMRKAETVRVKIGYPDTWKEYSTLEIEKEDAYGNRKRAALWDWHRQASRLGDQTDKNEWMMSPQTVNAYYNPMWNEIVFPAAILQPPFFDPKADPAVNYGAIGGVIGHEMGHGYDDQGAKYDETGVLRSWWNADDEKRFAEKVTQLARQYSAFEPLPGLHVNGEFTAGENIGDLGGLSVALEAYRISLAGKEPPVLDGFTGEQRFFLGWAQVWRSLIREELLRVRVTSDPHSPAEYRCNGVVRNMNDWYGAFDVTPGEKLYLPPAERLRIW
jgi:putative endopeptidase